MKKCFYLLSILAVFSFNCAKNIDELPYNPLDDNEFEFIKIDWFTFENYGKLTFGFTIDYDYSMNTGVQAIAIFKNGNLRSYLTNLDRRSFTESGLPIHATVCYEVALASNREQFSRKSKPLCIQT